MRSPLSWLRYCCLPAAILLSAGAACGAATPPGIPPEATPLEELLAESPSPSDYYRTAIQMWDGAPGLGALRLRWEGFAAARPGYAVLAALLAEAEGNPEAAIERLRTLPGAAAAWQLARIHAALGHEAAAVTLLEGLVGQKASPDPAAQALLALTERDCIRGDFAGALVRCRLAWAVQEGERFRLQVLERYVSLLVESGAEQAFVAEQLADLQSTDAERSRTARHVLAAVGEWFTGDKALRDLRSEVLREGIPGVGCGNEDMGMKRRQGTHRGFQPAGAALLKLAGDPATPLSLALPAANEMAQLNAGPDSLEPWPLLSRALGQRPLVLTMSLFAGAAQGVGPRAPLMEDVEKRLPPDVTRHVFSLWRRAWSGQSTAADAGELIQIIGEAPAARRYVPGWSSGGGMSSFNGWPFPPPLPEDALVWNLSGARFAGYYRQACRLQVLTQHGTLPYPESHPSAGMYEWHNWRPELPADGPGPIMHWAWEQLREMKADTPARFEEAAALLTDPGDRVLFAALTGHKDRLAEWCVNPAFVKQLRSAAIMPAVEALGFMAAPQDGEATPSPRAAAGLVMVEELAGRLGLKVPDLARVAGISSILHPKALASYTKEPMDENVASLLGLSSFDPAVRQLAEKRMIDAIPHPLFGLPAVVPSVARFTRLAGMLRPGSRTDPYCQSSDSAASYTLGQLLGWTAGGLPTLPLTEELAKFETNHPLKKRAQRWQELLQECAEAKPEPPPATGAALSARDLLPPQKAALARLAAEEKDPLEWQLVHLALTETDSAEQKALLVSLRSRSPLTLGTWLEPEPAAVSRTTPASPPPVTKTAGEAADVLVEAWSTPRGRQALEPAGAIARLFSDYSRRNALSVTLHPFLADAERLQELVTALLEKRDVLAARAAVWLAGHRTPELRIPVLAQAVAAFPDDPELLIAHAISAPDAPGAKAGYLRGLRAVKSLQMPGDGQSLQWCGVYGMAPWRDAEVAEVIAALGARAEHWQLPVDWVSILQGILKDAETIRHVKDVPLMVRTLLRHAKPVTDGNGQPEVWLTIINALTAAGHPATAVECAAGVLAMPRGDVIPPGSSDPVWPWLNAAGFTVTDRKAEGWAMLRIAAGNEPARLAEQLRQARAAHPGDEQIALAALLARGLAGPLTAEDLSLPADMAAAARLKVVALASWLLPESTLPPALCLEAWQADAAREFNANRHNGYRNFAQGLMYLDKLERAGAGERVTQLTGLMIECFAEMEWPDLYKAMAAGFVWRHGGPKEREALAAALSGHLERHRSLKDFAGVLAQTLSIFTAAPETMPQSVAGMVTEILKAGAGKLEPEASGEAGLCVVCEAAALYPRWHDGVRRVLALRQKDVLRPERTVLWGDLALLMKTLESGLLVPDLQLSLEPGTPGEGLLRWQFRGPVLSSPSGRAEPGRPSPGAKWQALANTLDGKFDAVILAEDLSGSGRRIAARLEKIAAAGEMKLTGLPEAGRLVIHLYGREAPRAAGETNPFEYNSSPLLIDTAIAPESLTHPPGWQLLGKPAAVGDIHSWSVRSHSASLPPSLHLLLLDGNGQVCAAVNVRHQFARHDDPPRKGLAAVAILPSLLTAGPSSMPSRAFSLTVAGPPQRVALAVPAGDSPDDGTAGRITLQELKDAAAPAATAGRLEIERIWFAVPGPEYTRPLLSGNGAFAAWLHGRTLSLVDVRSDSGPVVRELPVPENTSPRGVFWNGARLWLAFGGVPDQPKPETLLIEINAADAAPQPKVIRLPGNVEIAADYTSAGSASAVLVEKGKFRGVITAEGTVLESVDDRKFNYSRPLSPASIVCQPGPDRLYPVFDWSSGTLQLTFSGEIPRATPRPRTAPQWQTDDGGWLRETAEGQPRAFPLPLNIANPVPLGDNKLAAISEHGVVRLRIPPAPPR